MYNCYADIKAVACTQKYCGAVSKQLELKEALRGLQSMDMVTQHCAQPPPWTTTRGFGGVPSCDQQRWTSETRKSLMRGQNKMVCRKTTPIPNVQIGQDLPFLLGLHPTAFCVAARSAQYLQVGRKFSSSPTVKVRLCTSLPPSLAVSAFGLAADGRLFSSCAMLCCSHGRCKFLGHGPWSLVHGAVKRAFPSCSQAGGNSGYHQVNSEYYQVDTNLPIQV